MRLSSETFLGEIVDPPRPKISNGFFSGAVSWASVITAAEGRHLRHATTAPIKSRSTRRGMGMRWGLTAFGGSRPLLAADAALAADAGPRREETAALPTSISIAVRRWGARDAVDRAEKRRSCRPGRSWKSSIPTASRSLTPGSFRETTSASFSPTNTPARTLCT